MLRGSAGTSEIEVNAYGRVVREIARNEGQPGRMSCSRSTWRCRISSPNAAPRAERLLRAARRGHRRCARPGLEPELRPDAVLDRAYAGGVAGAVDRPAQPAIRQGDRRRSTRPARPSSRWSRWLRSKAARSPRIPQSPAPAISNLATRRSIAGRRAGTARCTCTTRSRNPATSSSTRPRGAPASTGLRRWLAASVSARLSASTYPGERGGLIPTRDWKLATTGVRLAARRDPDRRHRPGLRAGDAAADRDDGRAPGHRPRDRAAPRARAGPARRRAATGTSPPFRRSASASAPWRLCSTA